MRNILSVILLFTFVIKYSAVSQNSVVCNLPYEDMKRFHLGFQVGLHTQDLKIVNSGFVSPKGIPYFADVPYYSPGFNVGIMGDVTIIQDLDLRITPTLYFGDRPIMYTNGESIIKKVNTRSQLISIPILIKYSSSRYNNIRPYITTGIFGAFNLSNKKNQTIAFSRFDYGIQFGLGIDIYLKYFKLCPELSFSYGLGNNIDKYRKDLDGDNRIYFTYTIKRIQSKMIMLTFYFE